MLNRNKIAYIPADRAIALIYKQPIPEVCFGTALFADVSGFSSLAEALRRTLGDHQGAEALMRHMDALFQGLIQIVHRFGGSVIGFSGDAITCWFYGLHHGTPRQSALNAVASALEMHKVMAQSPHITLTDGTVVNLSMKVALASGIVRRIVVGDPEIQLIDTLVGKTITRMADGEKIAHHGETLADEATINYLANSVTVQAWRDSDTSDERFGIISRIIESPRATPWILMSDDHLAQDVLNQWLLPRVQMHLDASLGEFVPELRQAVALFMRFTGLEYDDDPYVQTKLDQFIRWVQGILVRYDGNLLQLTFGDKGSYLYAAFGAPVSHENDTYRAVSAALELSKVPENLKIDIQIGVSTGLMRTGAYGGALRRTYGVQGDEVNIAARLMTHAQVGTVLVSQLVYEKIKDSFNLEEQPAITIKGQPKALKVATLKSRKYTTTDTLTMAAIKTSTVVGRQHEMAQLRDAVHPILHNRFAGTVYILGESGMGKSRLIAELRHELEQGRTLTWMPVPCDPTYHIPLAPFAFLLNKIFDQAPDEDEAHNRARFKNAFQTIIQRLSQAQHIPAYVRPVLINELERTRPLLENLMAVSVDIGAKSLIDNPLALANIISGLKTLIQSMSLLQPLVIHVQESNWLDDDSFYLINELAQSGNEYPFALILSSRYGDNPRHKSLAITTKHKRRHTINLLPLPNDDVRGLMEQLLGGRVSKSLLDIVIDKCEGNPFFIEQFIHDLREQGLLTQDDGFWELNTDEAVVDLPAGTQAVIIARLDRLNTELRSLVQIASVLGTEFEISVLELMMDNAPDTRVRVVEGVFAGIWTRVDEDHYRFQHALLRDAAYAMQERAYLRELHERAAHAIQTLYPDDRAHRTDLSRHRHLANGAD